MATAGVGVQIDAQGLEALQRRMNRLAAIDFSEPMDIVGAEVESQTRRRIAKEKTGPDGKKWPAWSRRYAAKRKRGKSLLRSAGHLLDAIQYVATKETVEVGANLRYARIHQLGGTIKHPGGTPYGFSAFDDAGLGSGPIVFMKPGSKHAIGKTKPHDIPMPARPYLGLSAENVRDIEAELEDWFERKRLL